MFKKLKASLISYILDHYVPDLHIPIWSFQNMGKDNISIKRDCPKEGSHQGKFGLVAERKQPLSAGVQTLIRKREHLFAVSYAS